ncbi:MAG: IS1595 family transposase [Alphaproteobacteria bacterium]|nr:IS1595 family transposase [Alphaproteobacteria bacterium]
MSSDKPFVPRTLQEAIVFFADEENAFDFAVALRWPDGVFCPFCNGAEHSFLTTRKLWKCKGCKKQFSVRVGTIFEDSPIRLSKWFMAVWMLANCKNGVSSYELHRAIGVTQKTAWFMLHRVRAAIKAKSFDKKLAGIVETDECFVGGLFKNMHKSRRAKVRAESDLKGASTSRGAIGKTLVQAVLERKGDVRAQIINSMAVAERIAFIRENVEEGSKLMTDQASNYDAFRDGFAHAFVDHEREYVQGNVHTNSVENFWSLLSRSLHGTYANVEPFHLAAYVDEQAFRFNNRKATDGERFERALAMVPTARLTYKDLIRAGEA